jgi:hypothetical protein
MFRVNVTIEVLSVLRHDADQPVSTARKETAGHLVEGAGHCKIHVPKHDQGGVARLRLSGLN